MDRADRQAYDRNWYAKRSPASKAHKVRLQLARTKIIGALVQEYKTEHPCSCGEGHPAALDFHHREDDKEINIADAVRSGWSVKRLMIELQKCDVICANCHRKLHFAMRNRSASNNPTNPSPNRGVGEFARPRCTRNAEIAGRNPAAPTINSTSPTIAAAQSQSWS